MKKEPKPGTALTILPGQQRRFLVKAVNFSWYLVEQVKAKTKFRFGKPAEVSSTLILSEILYKSEFGDHPMSGLAYPEKSRKWANNLTLMPADIYWIGKTNEYEGVLYKAFEDWEAFGLHFSDGLAFHKGKINPFLLQNLGNSVYNSLIDNYSLRDYEFGEERGSI